MGLRPSLIWNDRCQALKMPRVFRWRRTLNQSDRFLQENEFVSNSRRNAPNVFSSQHDRLLQRKRFAGIGLRTRANQAASTVCQSDMRGLRPVRCSAMPQDIFASGVAHSIETRVRMALLHPAASEMARDLGPLRAWLSPAFVKPRESFSFYRFFPADVRGLPDVGEDCQKLAFRCLPRVCNMAGAGRNRICPGNRVLRVFFR